jgi:hypothetical protein
VIDAEETRGSVTSAVERALAIDRDGITHPYGNGRAGVRAAECIAEISRTREPSAIVRKRNSY